MPAPDAITSARTRRSHVSAVEQPSSGDQPTLSADARATEAVGAQSMTLPPCSAARPPRLTDVASTRSDLVEAATSGPPQSKAWGISTPCVLPTRGGPITATQSSELAIKSLGNGPMLPQPRNGR